MSDPIPDAALALWLAEEAGRRSILVHIARSDAKLRRLIGPATIFAGDAVEVLAIPGWDVLPYDPARPSPAIVGQRIAALLALARPSARPRLVLTSADAALQRVPPPGLWHDARITLAAGMPFDEDGLRGQLAGLGYRTHQEVQEPGEAALRGQVADLWPAEATAPVRLTLAEGRIAAVHSFDPLSQRSGERLESITLLPALEFPPDEEEAASLLQAEEEPPLPAPPSQLVPLFSLLTEAAYALDAEVEERWHDFAEQIADAYAATSKARRVAAIRGGALPRPSRLYLTAAQAMQAVEAGRIEATPDTQPQAAPRSTAELLDLLAAPEGAIVLACPGDTGPLLRSLARRGVVARAAGTWAEATRGGIAALPLEIGEGVRRAGLMVLPLAGLIRPPRQDASATLLEMEDAPRPGDLVVHADHGVARLRGLVLVDKEERVALDYADEADLLVEAWDLDRIWRLGGSAARLAPDRLGGESWQRTRAELQAEIEAAAKRLAALAAARARETAPRIAPGAPYRQIVRRFAYAPSPDQQAAIDAVLADLASGRPMNRLVCGDVGFGKTEIALRAAAAVALAGWQVAIAAPTTVLAHQHLETVRRRFAGFDLRIEGLIRGGATAEGRRVRAGLADGSVGIVVGTQGLAAEGVRFARLGLVIIDEEQRFGEGVKQRLVQLGRSVHQLAMTATPIPRTLQSALAGLRDCSVIATAPHRRQPTRTFILPWDPVVVREALLREGARGGQSFVVVSRIETLRRVEAELRALVPELAIIVAHGRMAPDALDAAMTGFAGGEGELLLATNIIEAGLDIPRANLILVREAERFGLAQLHQLRGRVGRGARRGTAYFMAEPGKRLASATAARLHTLEALNALGAGAALSAADLDLRGGGDLFGTEQAGHLRRIGTGMYQALLAEALGAARGEPPAPRPASVHGVESGYFPADWIAEEELRLALLGRLARVREVSALDRLAEDMSDRFGEMPKPAAALLNHARLRLVAGLHGVAQWERGPNAIALTPWQADAAQLAGLAHRLGGRVKDGRVIVVATAATVGQLLERLGKTQKVPTL